jgi:hypothetical protein
MFARPIEAAHEGGVKTISEVSTFPNQFKLLGVTGQCRIANIDVINLQYLQNTGHGIKSSILTRKIPQFCFHKKKEGKIP